MRGPKFYDMLGGSWNQAKWMLRDHLEQLDQSIRAALTMRAGTLRGRTSAQSGEQQEITVGPGLNMRLTELETTYSRPFMTMAKGN